jgi:NADH-quinone oxidoreductase subunit J
MDIQQSLFWVLSAMAIGCALGVVLSRNPITSVIFLILTFFAVSGHYILLNAQFLAIVNIIVYAGAIMVLFLFVIMLMNLSADTEPQKSKLAQLAGAVSGGVLFLVILAALRTAIYTTPLEKEANQIGLIKNLGRVLFREYVLPFEISSVLFLSAMIGAVVIGKREEGTSPQALVPRQPNQN